jgi:uncharacterized BrkB/YihY/UPF0761 family membrane protein
VGSAVAFRLFLFFVPLLVFLVGIAGFASGYVSSGDVNDAAGVSAGIASQISAAFRQSGNSRWIATAIGLFGMVTAGRSLSKVLWSASATAWRQPLTSKASLRVVGLLAGLMGGIGLVASIVNQLRGSLGLGAATVSFVPVLIVYLVGWLVIALLLPRGTPDPAASLPGAFVFGITLAVMQLVSQFYLPEHLSRASEIYGAIGTTVVTLGWFFILGRVAVLALMVDAVLYERFGSVATFVFSLPVLRALPRRSTRLREFFGLHEEPPSEPEP